MQVAVFGTNHFFLDLPSREKWIQVVRKVTSELSFPYPVSYILLITCNRCEIYFSSLELQHTADGFKRALQKELEFSIETKSYTYFEKDCFSHLAMVSSALESAQIGETDIRRQVKQSYEKARISSKLSSDLHFLFQKSLKVGKQFSGSIQGVEKEPTLEKVVSKMCLDVSDRLSLFFLGNSQINRKIIKKLSAKSGIDIWLCSKRTHFLCDPKIRLIDYSRKDLWKSCDVVISASDDQAFTIFPCLSDVKPKLFIDLSVPRSIDPEIEKMGEISLLNMDHLNQILEKSRLEFNDQVQVAKKNVAETVEKLALRFEEKSAICGAS